MVLPSSDLLRHGGGGGCAEPAREGCRPPVLPHRLARSRPARRTSCRAPPSPRPRAIRHADPKVVHHPWLAPLKVGSKEGTSAQGRPAALRERSHAVRGCPAQGWA